MSKTQNLEDSLLSTTQKLEMREEVLRCKEENEEELKMEVDQLTHEI
jgi:hypothetical protein